MGFTKEQRNDLTAETTETAERRMSELGELP
jgi:hypothetical protein